MPKFYLFVRFWPGFTKRFPFREFNELPDEEITQAVLNTVEQQFKGDPALAARWQKLLKHEAETKHAEALKHWRPV